MLRDYKFDPAFSDSSRKRKNRRRLRVLAVLVLAGSIASVRFTDLADFFADDGEIATTPQNASLTLPETPATTDQPGPAIAVISNPLVLPDNGTMATGRSENEGVGAEPGNTTTPGPSLLNSTQPLLPVQPQIQTSVEPKQDPIYPASMGPAWLEHKISAGESLAAIFKSNKLSPTLLHNVVNSSKEAKQLAKIRPGQLLRFRLSDDNELEVLELVRNKIESLRIERIDDGFNAEVISKAVETRVTETAGIIESSLFVAGQAAGLSDRQIMELAAVFGWDIDFALEIRAGDQFRLVYEEQYLEGEKFRDGPILAAEFVNRGKVYRAVRYKDDQGETGYYDEDGHNKRRAFIRTPIKFARVSSRFNPKRWHPVLKKWKSHKGVDYAAPIGTAIKATGAGKVIFRGWKGGYGRVVIVQHANKYSTLYAHMSKFASKAKAGRRVKQGQVIGFVGKSGRVTGPHLHYEFRVNGVHRNPLKVKLPKSLSLPRSQIASFKKQTAPLIDQLGAIKNHTMVAASSSAD